jgi:hypothetical protein
MVATHPSSMLCQWPYRALWKRFPSDRDDGCKRNDVMVIQKEPLWPNPRTNTARIGDERGHRVATCGHTSVVKCWRRQHVSTAFLLPFYLVANSDALRQARWLSWPASSPATPQFSLAMPAVVFMCILPSSAEAQLPGHKARLPSRFGHHEVSIHQHVSQSFAKPRNRVDTHIRAASVCQLLPPVAHREQRNHTKLSCSSCSIHQWARISLGMYRILWDVAACGSIMSA